MLSRVPGREDPFESYQDHHMFPILVRRYNPVGPFLPPPQEALKDKYHEELWDAFGIRFNDLFTITNM